MFRLLEGGDYSAPTPAGTVVAIVGWRAGARANSDGTIQSPANGVYRSDTGAPGTFQNVTSSGFAQQALHELDVGTARHLRHDRHAVANGRGSSLPGRRVRHDDVDRDPGVHAPHRR